MRVVLVGGAKDRDRVRAGLVEAGVEIVAELVVAPEPDSFPQPFDAIVTANPTPGPRIRPPLTPRELDVLALLAEGLSNKAIAQSLAISDQTVKFHVAAIIGKLGATNRTDAVRRAIRRGLVAI